MHFWLLMFVVALSSLQNRTGQAATGGEAQTGVVLSKLSEPAYPPMARIAHIQGAIEVKLGIRRDGSIESAVAIGIHPLLKQAALESAQQSLFECRGCGDEVTYYSLTYSFQFAAGSPQPNENNKFQVVQSQNRVTVLAQPEPIYIYFASVRVRSVKCLYLWSCGLRWGGEDYYYYRVRSAKCLYLWNCGLHRRDLPVP